MRYLLSVRQQEHPVKGIRIVPVKSQPPVVFERKECPFN